MDFMWRGIRRFMQVQVSPVSHTERLVSAAGGFLGVFLTVLASRMLVGPGGAALVIASMGASAVLLFAVPHGTLSQPWPLLGGHLISALIGVCCAKFIPNPLIAAAAAVSISIGAMHLLRCIHPPGGATALTAVLGGDAIHSLGFQYIVTPVLINAVIILIVAVAFSFPFSWRRYPANWAKPRRSTEAKTTHHSNISHADFVAALRKMDSFIDVNEQDLLRIYDLVTDAAQQHGPLKSIGPAPMENQSSS